MASWGYVVSLLAVFIRLVYTNPAPSEPFPHTAELDEQGNVFLYWKLGDDDTITIEIHARTLGWVGFGLSHNGGMTGADIVTGWVKDGQPYFQDRHGIGMTTPVVDNSQDYELLEARETEDFTILKFKRDLIICDDDDFDLEGSTSRVIYAWHSRDPETESDLMKHEHKGARSVLMLDAQTPTRDEALSSEQMDYFDLKVSNVHLSSDRTTYWCRILAGPKLLTKHHVVKAVPLIENHGIVHHIIAYICHGYLQQEEKGKICWEGNMPENATACDTLLFGYAIGQGDYYWPDEAGYPLGENGEVTFFNLEMHYDNPEGLSDVVDNSGLRFYYTQNLRKYDAGTLIVGHALWWPLMVIPPKADEFRLDAYCSKECTKSLHEDGINIFGSLLHTHLQGTKIWTKVIRNGTELKELARDNNYDFNLQQTRQISPPYKLMPGDELITSCTYQTRDKDNITIGGGGTDNEMCLAFFNYYPRSAVQSCISLTQSYYPIHQWVMQKAMAGEIDVDPVNTDMTSYDYLNKIEWTPENLRAMQEQIDHTEGFKEYCNLGNTNAGILGGGGGNYRPRIVIETPYKENNKCHVDLDPLDTSDAPTAAASHLFLLALAAMITYLHF